MGSAPTAADLALDCSRSVAHSPFIAQPGAGVLRSVTIGPIGCGKHSIGISKAGRVEDGPVSRLLHECEAGRLALQAAGVEGKREVHGHLLAPSRHDGA